MRAWLLIFAGLTSGCNWFVGDALVTSLKDRDGDGFIAVQAGGDDCDDASADVNPGRAEVCGDAIDNDCDGIVDDAGEGAATYYLDADGDGFGAETLFVVCPAQADSQWALQAGDCDDNDATRSPAAPDDDCDGIDDNCDGVADDEVDPLAPELCDGVDNDCDGGIDDDPTVAASTGGVTYGTVREAVLASQGNPVGVCPGIRTMPRITVGEGESLVVRGSLGREATGLLSLGGAGLFRVDGGALTLEDIGLTGTTQERSPVRVEAGELTLRRVRVYDNAASGVTFDSATPVPERLVIEDSQFDTLRTTGDGAALDLRSSTLVEIRGTTFADNQADEAGGAIYFDGAGTSSLEIVDSAFLRNRSDGFVGGAGLSLTGVSNIDLRETRFEGNVADWSGGGVELLVTNQEDVVRITDCTFTDNTAWQFPGVNILSQAPQLGEVDLSGSQFVQNVDTSGISPMTVGVEFADTNEGQLTAHGLVITDNTAGGLRLLNVAFDGDASTRVARNTGVGMIVFSITDFFDANPPPLVLDDLVVEGNGGVDEGVGGLLVSSDTNRTLAFRRVTVDGNTGDDAGGLLINGGRISFDEDSAVINNTAVLGGGAYLSNGTLTSNGADFGSALAGTDNEPRDVWLPGPGRSYGSLLSDPFECTATLCYTLAD